MSTTVALPTRALANCFGDLALLIPKGNKDLPVGIDLQAGVLTFYYNEGCVYKRSFEVSCSARVRCTVIYYAIADLLYTTEQDYTELEFAETCVYVKNDILTLTLQHGYSSVELPQLPYDGYTEVKSIMWKDGLRTLLNLGLDKLYSKVNPITVASGTATLKYGNTWARSKTTGMNLDRVLDIDHIRLILKFDPDSYQLIGIDSILFKHKNAFLQLPCRLPNDLAETDEFISTTLSSMQKPVDLYLSKYVDSVKGLAKLSNKAICNLVIFENGLQTNIDEAGANMSVMCGERGNVVGTAQMPINAWINFLRALGSEHIQLLVGGDLLCLRNQFLIILTHVRS